MLAPLSHIVAPLSAPLVYIYACMFNFKKKILSKILYKKPQKNPKKGEIFNKEKPKKSTHYIYSLYILLKITIYTFKNQLLSNSPALIQLLSNS